MPDMNGGPMAQGHHVTVSCKPNIIFRNFGFNH